MGNAATLHVAPARGKAEPAPLEVRPDAVVPLRRAGYEPLRVLLFGGGVLAGWGLLDHERGLPGHVADTLARRTGHGIDLDVIVELRPTSANALGLLQGLRVARYDAIVVVLGEDAVLQGAGRKSWAQDIHALARTLNSEASKTTPLFIFDSAQPMVAVSTTGLRRRRALSGAAQLAKVTRDISVGGRVRFDELAAPSSGLGWGRQFSTANLREWADAISKAVLPALNAVAKAEGPDTAAAMRNREQNEQYRQRAVDSLRLRRSERDSMLDALARQARASCAASDAFVTIVDGDRVWQRASSRSVLGERPRSHSICDLTVRTDRPTIVGDTSVDPRITGSPTMSETPMAFYAGAPIHTADGYRIGALCITNASPRTLPSSQLAELHILAGRVEKELWAATLGARH